MHALLSVSTHYYISVSKHCRPSFSCGQVYVVYDKEKVRPAVMLRPTGSSASTKAWVLENFSEPAQAMKGPTDFPSPKSGSAALVNATSVTPTRKSKHSAATADQDSVEKAAKSLKLAKIWTNILRQVTKKLIPSSLFLVMK